MDSHCPDAESHDTKGNTWTMEAFRQAVPLWDYRQDTQTPEVLEQVEAIIYDVADFI